MSERTPKTITFIARSTPYGNGRARALLDMVLSTAVFEQRVNLVFMDDGVWQLARGQQAKAIDAKDLGAALSALPLYDVQHIYVDERALLERGLSVEDLVIPASPCDDAHIANLIQHSDVIYQL